MSYNITEGFMVIDKSKRYIKSLEKLIIRKNLEVEYNRIQNIENLIIASKNLQDLINSPYKNIYYIEQKKGNLKEFYTARINSKLRLFMKPVGEYPYNKIEIDEIKFIEIDDSHYGEG